jgi:hypothetical protein
LGQGIWNLLGLGYRDRRRFLNGNVDLVLQFHLGLLRRIRALVSTTASASRTRVNEVDDVLESAGKNGFVDLLWQKSNDQEQQSNRDDMNNRSRQHTGSARDLIAEYLADVRTIPHRSN